MRRACMLMAILAVAVVPVAGRAASFQKRVGVVVAPLPLEACPGFIDAVASTSVRRHVQPRFAVDGETWGRAFTLTPLLPASNLDISFRVGSYWIPFGGKSLSVQSGWVPYGASEAAVCLRGGLPTRFVYRAG